MLPYPTPAQYNAPARLMAHEFSGPARAAPNAITVTVLLAVTPSIEPVIVVTPGATARTSPFVPERSTAAISGCVDDHVRTRSETDPPEASRGVGKSCSACPR